MGLIRSESRRNSGREPVLGIYLPTAPSFSHHYKLASRFMAHRQVLNTLDKDALAHRPSRRMDAAKPIPIV